MLMSVILKLCYNLITVQFGEPGKVACVDCVVEDIWCIDG